MEENLSQKKLSEEIFFKEWLKNAANELASNLNIKKEIAYQEANYLAKIISGIELLSDDQLSQIAQLCLNSALKKRAAHMPLAKISQKKSFYNHFFITTEDTLDPRPESEMIIDLIDIKARSVLDLGTGTGCLILSILKKLENIYFSKIHGLAIDISYHALKIAQENAKILKIDKIEFKQNNWANGINDHFDLIVCNPPYIAQDYPLAPEIKYDPTLALFGNIKTYEEIFNSMINIKFFQMLIEIPNYLLPQISKMSYLNEFHYEIIPIDKTEISILNIHAKNIPPKILQNKKHFPTKL